MRKNVLYKSEFVVLSVLGDGVQFGLFRDFHFGVGPSWDFDDEVNSGVGEGRNVVEERGGFVIDEEEEFVVLGVLGAVLFEGVFWGHVLKNRMEKISKNMEQKMLQIMEQKYKTIICSRKCCKLWSRNM